MTERRPQRVPTLCERFASTGTRARTHDHNNMPLCTHVRQATLEGSMTGGQAQIDAETRIAWDAHGRLESLLQGTRTEECRGEIIKTYQEYLGAQALVRPCRSPGGEGGGVGWGTGDGRGQTRSSPIHRWEGEGLLCLFGCRLGSFIHKICYSFLFRASLESSGLRF